MTTKVDHDLTRKVPLALDGDSVSALLGGAMRLGNDPVVILRKAGLPPEVFECGAARIDGKQFGRLVYAIKGEMNDLFMGFLDQPAKLSMERAIAPSRFRCATFGELLRTYTEFREAVRNDIHYELKAGPNCGEFTLEINYDTVPNVDRELFHWYRMLSVYRYCCWFVGRRIVLNRVGIVGPKTQSTGLLKRFSVFDCELAFDQSAFSLAFDKRCLLFPVVRHDESEHVELGVNFSDWFRIPGEGVGWARQTERAIIGLQRDGVWSPKLGVVSAMLSVSPRSLRRYLDREGVSFTKIKARVRCELAIAYLMATDLPIGLVADEVGFGEPGDFTQAFRGWTGCNPSAYRKRGVGDSDLMAMCAARLRDHTRI